MTPSQFWGLPKEEQAAMIAFIQSRAKMMAWEDKLERQRLDRLEK